MNRQLEMLQWIRDYTRANGWPPSLREIGLAFDWSTPSTTHYHMIKLERAGLVERGAGPRQIRLTKKGRRETL